MASLVEGNRTEIVHGVADDVHHAAERPRPTGTEMVPPWSMAFIRAHMPSVASMATQRTRPSPRCCCTSRMTLTGKAR